jgi:prepilin-type N-terminal cleavage/methylation domain-containing protein
MVKRTNAFTIIELLIVTAIILIFASISIAYFNYFTEEKKLENEAKKLINVMDLAKKKASSGDQFGACTDLTGYSVDVGASSYVMKGCCTGTCSETIASYSYDPAITATAGTGEIIFSLLSAGTNLSGTRSVILRNDISDQCITLTIGVNGLVSFDSTKSSC